MQKDGHTHTEFCPHGNGDSAELMIQKAIKMGFDEYSITEHAPLPADFRAEYAGSVSGIDEASLRLDQVADYLTQMHALQAKYRDQIKITVGFEVDYLPHHVAWTRDFLNEYGPQTDESILSCHFMQGTDDKFWCVDNKLEEFETGLLPLGAGNQQELYRRYLELMQAAADADLGDFAPKRMGHITLIKKFQDYFDLPREFDAANMARVERLLETIQRQGRELDFNAGGLYKPYCNETYPTSRIVWMARARKIPLVYGSDAHGIDQVGRGYHQLATLMPVY